MIELPLQFLRSLGGFGTLTLDVADNGDLELSQTTVTIKPSYQDRKNEQAFINRIKKQLEPGDRLELRYEAGNLVVAQIHRK